MSLNAFKVSTMVMVASLTGNVDIATAYQVLPLTCPKSITGQAISIVSGAREKVPYYGTPNIIVGLRYNGKSRGIRTGGGQLSNVVSIDLQCQEKNIHLKLSNNNVQLTGALSEEMGCNAFGILCQHLNMAQSHIQHITSLPLEIKEATRQWVLQVAKGPPVVEGDRKGIFALPISAGSNYMPPSPPPSLNDLQTIVTQTKLHRRTSNTDAKSQQPRTAPLIRLPTSGMVGQPSVSRSKTTPNSPYNPGVDSLSAIPPPTLAVRSVSTTQPSNTQYRVIEMTNQILQSCPAELDARMAGFLLVHTFGYDLYSDYESKVNTLLQIKFVCMPNLNINSARVSNAVYNYKSSLVEPLPLLQISEFLHRKELDVSYHNWNSRCVHISIPVLRKDDSSSRDSSPTPSPSLSERGLDSSHSYTTDVSVTSTIQGDNELDLSIDSEDDDVESTRSSSKHKDKIYAHRFTVYSKGTVRQSSPTTYEQAYAAYIKVMSLLEEFRPVS
jgi:hypothetical protein